MFAVGDNSKCQLAQSPDQAPFINEPIQVEILPAIQKIACSTYSTAISTTGDLYVWGLGSFGKYPAPHRVSGMPGRAETCSVSKSHICVMDSDNMAWVWGYNDKGELGLGDYTTRTAPFPLVGLQEKGITHIQVGHQFSIGFAKPKADVRIQDVALIRKAPSKDHITNLGIKTIKRKSIDSKSTSEGATSF